MNELKKMKNTHLDWAEFVVEWRYSTADRWRENATFFKKEDAIDHAKTHLTYPWRVVKRIEEIVHSCDPMETLSAKS